MYEEALLYINVSTVNVTVDARLGTLFFSLTFFAVTLVSTIYLYLRHLANWTDPIAQTSICRIITMNPIYSISCFFSIMFYKQAVYFELVRDCYESFVLYEFLCLLIYFFNCECRKLENIKNTEEFSITTADESDYQMTSLKEDNELMVVDSSNVYDPSSSPFTFSSSSSSSSSLKSKNVNLDDEETIKTVAATTTTTTKSKGEERGDIDALYETGEFLRKHASIQSHPFPCCCLPLIHPGIEFLIQTKRAVMQYIFIRPLCALIGIIMHSFDLYHHGSFSLYYSYIWITLIINFSAIISLYWLVIFFKAILEIISNHRPLPKFLSIKLMIFVIFWQSIILSLAYYFSLIPTISSLDNQESANVFNNFIISFEIMILALINIRIYTHEVYIKKDSDNDEKLSKLIKEGVKALSSDVLNLKNVVDDTSTTFNRKVVHELNKID